MPRKSAVKKKFTANPAISKSRNFSIRKSDNGGVIVDSYDTKGNTTLTFDSISKAKAAINKMIDG